MKLRWLNLCRFPIELFETLAQDFGMLSKLRFSFLSSFRIFSSIETAKQANQKQSMGIVS